MQRENGRRRLLGAQPVVVAGGRHAATQQVAVLVHAAQQRGGEGREPPAFELGLAGQEEVGAGVGVEAPVVVLAAAVEAGERLFVKQDREIVLGGQIAQHVHRQDVRVGGEIGQIEDRRNLVLGGRDLVVGAPDRDSQPPHPLPGLGHEAVHAIRQPGEVVVRQLLAARRRGAEQGASRGDEVRPRQIHAAVDQEELLLPADVAHHRGRLRVAEMVQQPQGLLVDRHARPQQGRLLVQGLAGPGHEGGRNVERLAVDEGRRTRVPSHVGRRLVGLAQPAVGKGRPVGLGLEQVPARQGDDEAVGVEVDADEGLELLAVDGAAHRREPVRIADAPLRLGPLPDGLGQGVGEPLVHRHAGRAALREGVIDFRIHQLLENGVVQHVPVDVRQFGRQGHGLRRGVMGGVGRGHGCYSRGDDTKPRTGVARNPAAAARNAATPATTGPRRATDGSRTACRNR